MAPKRRPRSMMKMKIAIDSRRMRRTILRRRPRGAASGCAPINVRASMGSFMGLLARSIEEIEVHREVDGRRKERRAGTAAAAVRLVFRDASVTVGDDLVAAGVEA